jgi:hypothetical protein
MTFLSRLFGRPHVPDGAVGPLGPDEHVLASAELAGGGHVVATSLGLWLPDPSSAGPRLVGWHLISKATWQSGSLVVIEADEKDVSDGVVLVVDRAPQRLRMSEPGKVPQVVHERVTGSIKTRHHRDLPDGGAWFVQRKVPGRDGYVLQVRPDPGTDEAAVRQLAANVANTLGL